MPLKYNILGGEGCFLYKTDHIIRDKAEVVYALCLRSHALYCLHTHCTPYLHKVKHFSTLLHPWTRQQLVSNARCRSCRRESAALIENE